MNHSFKVSTFLEHAIGFGAQAVGGGVSPRLSLKVPEIKKKKELLCFQCLDYMELIYESVSLRGRCCHGIMSNKRKSSV